MATNFLPAARTKPSFSEQLSGAIGTGLNMAGEGLRGYKESEALRQQGIDPSLPREFQQLSYEAKLKKEKMANELQGNRGVLRDAEKRYGLKEGELEPYIQNPAMGLNLIEKTNKKPSVTQASQPINPDQLEKIQNVRNRPEFESASPSKKYQMFTNNGVSKENASTEAKIYADEAKPSMFESESSKLAAKSSSQYRDKVVKEYEEANLSDFRISKMLKKAESGVLPTPIMVKTLDAFGLPLSILKNPEAEEFEKLRAEYVTGVSNIFPGAIKNFEIESYMKTIPGLLNSDEGKSLIAKNIQIQNKAKIIKYDALKQILKENGGVEPRNLDIAINDLTRDSLNELKEEFMNNVHDSLSLSGPKISMVDEEGNFFDVPTYDLESAFKDGLKIYNE